MSGCDLINYLKNCEFLIVEWCIYIRFEVCKSRDTLQKQTLDIEQFKSCHPVSNLLFLSKSVALCLNSYMLASGFNEKHQFAYKQPHSTETTLVCVANHILCCVDQKKAVSVVLLYLSAAFDTFDSNVLLDHMFK